MWYEGELEEDESHREKGSFIDHKLTNNLQPHTGRITSKERGVVLGAPRIVLWLLLLRDHGRKWVRGSPRLLLLLLLVVHLLLLLLLILTLSLRLNLRDAISCGLSVQTWLSVKGIRRHIRRPLLLLLRRLKRRKEFGPGWLGCRISQVDQVEFGRVRLPLGLWL